MPNMSGKEFDRRYNNRRKSSEEDYYSNGHFQYPDTFNQMYRNSSRDKKGVSSFQSSSDMKQPLRSFGDWSEFLSSNGKIYFYNRKTERAQWDKPDEWDWLVMQEEKTSKSYYQQSSKDNRSANRFRNKYENEMFDSSMKSQRYNNYDKYHRDYPGDYMNSNQANTFRQNYPISDRYSNQNGSMQNFSQSNSVQMNDYYDSAQSYPVNVPSSASNSDYYQKNNAMYRNNNYHNKEWPHMSKMQYLPNGANSLSSPNNPKNSPRCPNQYDDSNMNKSYAYQQHRQHMSRYDNYSENSVNNQKYTYNHSNSNSNNNSNNSSYQNADYNNFNNNSSHTINNNNNNSQSSTLNRSNNTLNKDHKFVAVANHQPSTQNGCQNQSRSRTNSENTGFSPSCKKFKRSEDNSQSRNADEESWDDTMEEKSSSEIQEKEQKCENQSPNESAKTNENKQETKLTEKMEEKSEAGVKSEVEEGKENQAEQKHADPVLTSTVDDINKYYRSELVDSLTNCLGVVENLSWINQSYSKHFYYSKFSVDIKNYRSIVRVKEIKKTQLEQRLLFLQNQMREIEELLG